MSPSCFTGIVCKFKDVSCNQTGIWSEQFLRLGGLNHAFGISITKADVIRFRLLNLWPSLEPMVGSSQPFIRAGTMHWSVPLKLSMHLNFFPNAACPYVIACQTHSLLAEVRYQILRLQPAGVCTIPATLMQPSVCFANLYPLLSGGLLAGRNISDDGVIDAPGSRWDPTASSIAPLFYRLYGPMLPVLKELKDVAASKAPWRPPALTGIIAHSLFRINVVLGWRKWLRDGCSIIAHSALMMESC